MHSECVLCRLSGEIGNDGPLNRLTTQRGRYISSRPSVVGPQLWYNRTFFDVFICFTILLCFDV